MSNQKTLSFRTATARLLATENIVVNQTNSKTAWFDVEKRILNLPMWDVEDYVYDMLVGHEVGHALYTPAEGWHDSIKDMGIPRSYINVVEDARIEKLVKRQYPGMVNTFTRSYNWFHKQDFFKLDGKDIYAMNLIDRINCFFKLGDNMYVPFTDGEKQFVQMTAECETFDEVVDTCKAIMEYWKDNKDELKEQLQEMREEASADDADGEEITEGYGEASDSDEEDEDATGTRRFVQETADNSDNPVEDDTYDTRSGANDGQEDDDDDSEASTDVAQRSNESSLLQSSDGSIIKFFPREAVKHMVIPSERYYASERVATGRRNQWRAWTDYVDMPYNEAIHGSPSIGYSDFCSTVLFKKFLNETNRVVSYLAKEFDQKKAAYQYSRAKVSTSGVLNTSVLHKYKFSEDVFKRTMSLADAKSHGMIITLDFSGSMGDVIYDTIVQALNLAMFCRRVSIPFEMYTFTTGARYKTEAEDNAYRETMDAMSVISGTVLPHSVDMNQLFSSKMTKRQFDNAVKNTFLLACGFYNEYDGMGSTPTNETLMALRYIIEDFQSRHRVQKLINVLLTDGEPNRVSWSSAGDPFSSRYRGSLQLKGNKFVKVDNMDSDMSVKLLNFLRDEYKVVNLGYFLGDQHTMRRAVSVCADSNYTAISKIKSDIRKYGSYAQKNVAGYDQYFLIRSSKFSIQDDDFEVEDNATKKTIAKEFSKFTKGRRQSRVLLDQFIKNVV